ncbi:hypothetical protein LTR85_004147 [Meristemomyces frigidus]|nr:hypothetical protein LTR85_004147 [Meristemomyces frigidus]
MTAGPAHWQQYQLCGHGRSGHQQRDDHTTTSTRYNTEVVVDGWTTAVSGFLDNGTVSSALTPSTTRTWTVELYSGNPSDTTVLTYPTPFFQVASVIAWEGTLPYTTNGTKLCASWGTPNPTASLAPTSLAASPTPAHPSWPSPTGTVDPNDPYGGYYMLTEVLGSEVLNLTQVEDLFPGNAVLAGIYESCTPVRYPLAATAVRSVTALLDTTTTYMPQPDSSSSTKSWANTLRSSQPQSSLTTSQPAANLFLAAPASVRPTASVTSPATKQSVRASVSSVPTESALASGSSCSNIGCFVISALGGSVQSGIPQPETAHSTAIQVSQLSAEHSTVSLQSTGSIDVSLGPSSQVTVAGQTLAPGSTITVGIGPSATTLILQMSGSQPVVIANGVTSAVPTISSQQVSIHAATIARSPMTANCAGYFVVVSSTLSPSGPAVTEYGSVYSLASIGGDIMASPQLTATIGQGLVETPAPTLTAAGATPMMDSASRYEIDSQTLSPGGLAITVSGTTYSLLSSGTAIVINGHTSALSIGAPEATSSQQWQELLPGSVLVIAGTTYSLPSSGAGIYVNGVSGALPTAAGGPTDTLNSPALASSNVNGYLIAGQSLDPGSDVVVSGTTYSLPSVGPGLYVNGLSTALASGASPTPVGGVLITPSSVTEYLVAGQTLVPGSDVVVSGPTYSLPANGPGVYVKWHFHLAAFRNFAYSGRCRFHDAERGIRLERESARDGHGQQRTQHGS